jgi:HSP20 family molecular chaperone IbpA
MATRPDLDAWMWAEACELLGKAEQLHRQFFRLTGNVRTPAMWEPPIDVFEDDAEIVVVVAMPGVTAERLQVTHEPGWLVVRGTRPLLLAGRGHRVRRLEIPYGAFERRLPLPPGRIEVGVPELAEGCLVIRLRKVEEGARR